MRATIWAGIAVLGLSTGAGSVPLERAGAVVPACTIVGTSGNDLLVGTAGRDVICGGAGHDRIYGRGGDDVIRGGYGNDLILGEAGDDRVDGGFGNDRILGGAGDDWLRGQAGNDTIAGEEGDDVVFGDSGDDLISGGAGTDKLIGGAGVDVLRGVDSAKLRELLDCGTGQDRAYANERDLLRGCESQAITPDPAPHPPTQHAPVAVDDQLTGTEDTVLSVPVTGAGSPAANDTDADGGTLTVVAVSGATGGTVAIVSGQIELTPTADLCGTAAAGFDYTVEDPTGRDDTGHVTVDLTCAPDEPVAVDDEVTVTEDAVNAVLDVLANDSDADGDPLVPTVVTQPAHGSADVSGGQVRYTPDADYCTTPPGTDPDAFTYRLSAGSAPATVTVAVTCVDDAPVAVDDTFLLDEDDTATALTVLANDTDVDGGAISIDAVTQPAHGTVTVTGGGTGLTYAPAADYCNAPPGTDPDTFTYTLAPGGSTADVDVTVTCVEDAAVANDDDLTVSEDAAATVVDVLDNDVAGDGGAPSVTAVTDPAHGSATLVSGVVRYQPDPDYCAAPPAVDTFDYTISGGSSATVSVTVTCVNDAPTATDIAFSSARAAVGNTTLVIDDPSDAAPGVATPHKTVLGDVLAGASDVETPGSVVLVEETVTTALGGTATIEADGDITYRPPAGCSGTDDTFTYTVSDGDATGTAVATIASADCVWYVDSDASGDSGTSAAPFDTVAQAVAAGAANHTLYVAQGSGSYDAAVPLKAGQRLVGAAVDLDVAGSVLASGAAGERPTLTRSGGDVVTLATGNLVTGVQIDPSGAGSGIAGAAGAGTATVSDVRIVDTGTAGTDALLDLDGTSGTTSIADLSVDSSGASGATSGSVGVRLNNAGTVTFAPSSTVAITTKGARGLAVTSTALGTSTFDQVTVTGSGSGGVGLSGATGTITFGGLSLTSTSGPTAAFAVTGSGSVTVASGGTAVVDATGGPAVDVTSTPAPSLSFDAVSSTNSASDGINLDGLTTGTFGATGGTLSGAAGIAFDVNAGSGDITFGGAVADGSGASAEVTGRTGGTVTLSGTVTDGADAGGGIRVSGNTGGATVLSGASKTFSTGASTAVAMASSDGHALRLTGGGLSVTTTSGKGVDAAASGTLVVSGGGNQITSTTGRALGVASTDIGAAGLTFASISSDGAANGIVLDGTGSAGSLQVTGSGGTCTAAVTSGCTGGEIAHGTGADSSSLVPAGTGIVLHDTQAPSLTRMWVHDHSNYAIRGSGVRGLTIADSVINGANGDNGTTPFDDSSILLADLTGTASISDTHVSGGIEDNLRVVNAAGSLDRLTLDTVDFAASGTRPANDAVSLESTGTASALKATVTGSTFRSAAGDLLQVTHGGAGAGDLVLTGNTFSNSHPAIATGGGGVTVVQSGTAGATTLAVTGNSFRDAVGPGLLFVKDAGTSRQQGTFSNNTVGASGVADSGSVSGSGLKLQLVGGGSSEWTVANNQIRGYNNMGIEVVAGGGASAQSGTVNTTITGNTLTEPGTAPGTIGLAKQAIHYNIGTQPGDTFLACAVVSGNQLATGGADSNPPTIDADIRLRQRQGTTIRLPGYAGANNDNAAVQSFVAAANATGGPTVAASNTVASGGGGFTGAACPVLP